MVELLIINKIKEGYTSEILREIMEWVVVVVVSIAIYLLISTYLIAPFTVKGHSMDYTFADNDKVFVNKFSKNY